MLGSYCHLLTNIGVAESLLRMHRRTAACFSDFLHLPENKHNQRAKEAVHCVRHFPPGELILQVIKVWKPTDFLNTDLINRFTDPPWKWKSWHCPHNDNNNTVPIVLANNYFLVRSGLSLAGRKIMRVMLTFADNLCYFTFMCTRALYSDCLVWVCFRLTRSGSFFKAARTDSSHPSRNVQRWATVRWRSSLSSGMSIFCLSRCDSQLMSYRCGHWFEEVPWKNTKIKLRSEIRHGNMTALAFAFIKGDWRWRPI